MRKSIIAVMIIMIVCFYLGVVYASEKKTEDIALHKPLDASSEWPAYPIVNANDGDVYTYWESQGYPAEVVIDLENLAHISSVGIRLNPDPIWGTRSQTIEVLVSVDGLEYIKAVGKKKYTYNPSSGNKINIKFKTVDARYVKLVFYSGTWSNGAQAAEISVNGLVEIDENELSNIPADAKQYNSHMYKVYRQKLSWNEAKEKCEKLGGHLATITSSDEQSFIEQLCRNKGELWIGLRRVNDNSFAWVTGEQVSFTNWGGGEPNNYWQLDYPGENTVAARPDWNDYHENNLENISGYICEWDSAEQSMVAASVTTPVPILQEEKSDSVDFVETNSGDVRQKETRTGITSLPSVIFTNNDMIVTIRDADSDSMTLEIINNGTEDIEFSLCGIALNKCMLYISNDGTKTIAAGKRFVEKYKFTSKKDYGIIVAEVVDVGLRFWTGDQKYVFGSVQLVEKPSFEFLPEGKLFYEDDYVKGYLICTGKNYKDIEVIYYNKTGTMINSRFVDTAFNDIMISTVKKVFESDDILPHCYFRTKVGDDIYYTLWNALEDEVKEKELEPINMITGKIEVISLVDWFSDKSSEITIYVDDYNIPTDSGGDSNLVNKKILFRNLSWGSNIAAFENAFENQHVSKNDDEYLIRWSNRKVEEDPNTVNLNSMYGDGYPAGWGTLIISTDRENGFKVSGYHVSTILGLFAYSVDDAGNVLRSESDSRFYMAEYGFDVEDGIAAYDDLKAKITDLYGQGTETSVKSMTLIVDDDASAKYVASVITRYLIFDDVEGACMLEKVETDEKCISLSLVYADVNSDKMIDEVIQAIKHEKLVNESTDSFENYDGL